MRVYGTATLADILGGRVAYRSLRPADASLPSGSAIAEQLGIGAATALRKGDEAYARVVAEILRAAHPGIGLQRLVVLGDTRMSDGGAFQTLCAATGWPGRAFIGQDSSDAPTTTSDSGTTYANRWTALRPFAAALDAMGFVDAHTAVVIDIDKTLLGARGRNDHLINTARLAALRDASAEVLGSQFDETAFAANYHAIDTARFHPLTGDNQDYVAYISVMTTAGVLDQAKLDEQFTAGQIVDFAHLLAMVTDQHRWPTPELQAFHEEIAQLVESGDATPFKDFRRREFAETVRRLGTHPDSTPAEVLLQQELVITGEVWEVARRWKQTGALLFGLSDKPDEAAMPPEGSSALPLHRISTHIVGT